RDLIVTGVQTCALPIFFEGPPEGFDKVFLENLLMTMTKTLRNMGFVRDSHVRYLDGKAKELQDNGKFLNDLSGITSLSKLGLPEIGRASCRERVKITRV